MSAYTCSICDLHVLAVAHPDKVNPVGCGDTSVHADRGSCSVHACSTEAGEGRGRETLLLRTSIDLYQPVWFMHWSHVVFTSRVSSSSSVSQHQSNNILISMCTCMGVISLIPSPMYTVFRTQTAKSIHICLQIWLSAWPRGPFPSYLTSSSFNHLC